MNQILKIPLVVLSAVWWIVATAMQLLCTFALSIILFVLFYALIVGSIFWILTH
ncbi:MAG: hypothetical protein SNF92_09245 [Rikenellaceae bacterium]